MTNTRNRTTKGKTNKKTLINNGIKGNNRKEI